MAGLTNTYIHNFLSTQSSHYKGVFSSNNIDKDLKYLKRFSIVCNLSKYGEIGSHFVSIISFPDYVFYIDSLGLPCIAPSICAFLSSLNKSVFINTRQFQQETSIYCGFYCIMFVLYYDKKRNFQLNFNSALMRDNNDAKCIMYVRKLIK